MIHLSKSTRPTPKGATLHRRRADSPVARPIQPTSAMKSAARDRPRRSRSAASRAGEPSCQPPHISATAPETANTPEKEGQRSPDPVTRISSAPPTIPKAVETLGHQAVDRGAPSVKAGIWSPGADVNRKNAESAIAPATEPRNAFGGPSATGVPSCARSVALLHLRQGACEPIGHDGPLVG